MACQRRVIVKGALILSMSIFVPILGARAETRADASITLRAQSALLVAGDWMSMVHVDTSGGRITLYGTVQSQRQKARAAEEVRNATGVVRVRNLLQVVAPGNTNRVRRSDVALKADVQKTLRADRSLDDSRITVKSVNNGVVLLGGKTASSNDNVRALRSTADRPGVNRVFSEIEALDTFAVPSGARLAGMPFGEMSAGGQDPLAAADDEAIRRGVVNALDDLGGRENADIRVLVRNGVVWLSGSVPSWQGNSSRVYAARSVTGVRSIMNELRVVATNFDRR